MVITEGRFPRPQQQLLLRSRRTGSYPHPSASSLLLRFHLLLLLPIHLLLLRRLLLLSKRLSLGRSPLHSKDWAFWTFKKNSAITNMFINSVKVHCILCIWKFMMNWPYASDKDWRITSIWKFLSKMIPSFSSSSRFLIIVKQRSWTDCPSRILV